GRTVLATWSGECESPSAYVVDVATGGAVALGSQDDQQRDSVGLGWSGSGQAVVHFRTGLCGTPVPVPGVYRVDADGTVVGLVTEIYDHAGYADLLQLG